MINYNFQAWIVSQVAVWTAVLLCYARHVQNPYLTTGAVAGLFFCLLFVFYVLTAKIRSVFIHVIDSAEGLDIKEKPTSKPGKWSGPQTHLKSQEELSMRMILAITVLLFLPLSLRADPVTNVMRASCLFGGGKAFVYREDAKNFYLLTAGHCIDKQQGRTVQFFHAGLSPQIPCRVLVFEHDTRHPGQIVFLDPTPEQGAIIERDVGILVVRKADLGNYPWPIAIPLATDANYQLELEDPILYAHTGQPLAIVWENPYFFRVSTRRPAIRPKRGYPPREPFSLTHGSSGSGFTNADGTKLLGIVKSGIKGDPSVIHFHAIKRVLEKKGL